MVVYFGWDEQTRLPDPISASQFLGAGLDPHGRMPEQLQGVVCVVRATNIETPRRLSKAAHHRLITI
jgi:hypothetical protein